MNRLRLTLLSLIFCLGASSMTQTMSLAKYVSEVSKNKSLTALLCGGGMWLIYKFVSWHFAKQAMQQRITHKPVARTVANKKLVPKDLIMMFKSNIHTLQLTEEQFNIRFPGALKEHGLTFEKLKNS